MKFFAASRLIASVAVVSAHNAQVLSSSQSHRLHQARSLCSRDVHCILNKEATEGPFYIPRPLIRSNLTEDRVGVPLNLKINVVDVTKCEPAKDVWVDIWHADAHGEYSGWASGDAVAPSMGGLGFLHRALDGQPDHGPPNHGPPDHGPPGHGPPPPGRGGSHTPPETSRWLRGVSRTDKTGLATFDTIMPAWYAGRTTHIHIRLHTGNTTTEDGMLVGEGNVAHTGQLFFADELVLELAKYEEPYKTHAETLPPKLNQDDGIYMHSDGQEQLVTVERFTGIIMGSVTVGIDPTADHHEDKGTPGRHLDLATIAIGVAAVCAVLLLAFFALRWFRNRRTTGYIALPTDE